MSQNQSGALENFRYDDKIVRLFVYATLFWGVVAFLVGLFIASQLVDWRLNFDLPWLTYGRLRPLHTNAAIFAFTCNAIFAAVYYSTQRLCKARLFSDALSQIHFWGWQLIIVTAAICFVLGISQSREYAELIWPVDIAVAAIWVIFGVNFFGTLIKRREKHLYVALWFYIATIIAIALLHIVNNIQIPVTWTLSYSVFAGVQDALVQWWYGHNAVGFLLTTPILGMMYYFLPKAANKPVFSYRLSIIHFWGLIFIYMWAGPHHLYYSALPSWTQSLGMVFSIMLLAPSWGGMLNGLLTLRGAWDRVRREPVLKFFVGGVTAYGMATFEGPLLSIPTVNKVSHFTDWTIAHVHVGALGWLGFMTFGMIYWLVPKLWNRPLYSEKLANAHFWIALMGIVIYAVSMWSAGVTQALMWFATDEAGRLVYPDFMETLIAIKPMHVLRAVGGLLYVIGAGLMVYNFARSVWGASPEDLKDTEASAPPLKYTPFKDQVSHLVDDKGRPIKGFWKKVHRVFEGWPMAFTAIAFVAIFIGGFVEIVPMIIAQAKTPMNVQVKPYTPLELLGRDIYVGEGCYTCHSQHVRHILAETKRYGPVSKAYEYQHDRPFQWGSKRTGPDLHRVGGKYPDLWHYRHMENPRSTTPNSWMPGYPWLLENKFDTETLEKRLKALKTLGAPYTQDQIRNAKKLAREQAQEIAGRLKEEGNIEGVEDKQIVALIAYLQSLGRHRVPDDQLLEVTYD